MKKKKRPYLLTAVILTALILVFNLAGMNRSFCDFYTDNIYHFIADGLGFITAPIPFPLGETLMYAGAVTVIVFVLSLILLIFFHRKNQQKAGAGIIHLSAQLRLIWEDKAGKRLANANLRS